MSKTTIFYATTPSALSATNPHITVEAEYGDFTVTGSQLTFAHHGVNSHNRCPAVSWERNFSRCTWFVTDISGQQEVWPEMLVKEGELRIGVSHFDLDTLLGLFWILRPWTEVPEEFRRLAEFVDLNGVHELLKQLDRWSTKTLDQYWAFCALSQDYRLAKPPKAEEAVEVTEFFRDFAGMLCAIFDGNESYLIKGRAWFAAQDKLEKESRVATFDDNTVVLRKSPQFVNHLYSDCDGVAAYNETTKSYTLSTAVEWPGWSVGEFCKALWGPEAGGHAQIGGSPRGVEYDGSEMYAVGEAFSKALKALKENK